MRWFIGSDACLLALWVALVVFAMTAAGAGHLFSGAHTRDLAMALDFGAGSSDPVTSHLRNRLPQIQG